MQNRSRFSVFVVEYLPIGRVTTSLPLLERFVISLMIPLIPELDHGL